MAKHQHLKHVLELNLAVLLISTSGPLGRFIATPPPITIWWRCLFAAVLLGVYCYYKGINLKIKSRKDWRSILISSIFMGAHWITYFYALHLSNVAIGMLSLFTYPVITALIEPFFFATRISKTHVAMGTMVLFGIYFLVPDFSLENEYTVGIIFGLVSAVFYAIRNILMKKHIGVYHGTMLMFYQMLIVTALLWPVLFVYQVTPALSDWATLVVLALVTTSVGHTLFVMSFKHFSISTASIMSSVQPIFGIILGIFFLGETPIWSTLIGGTLIVLTVIIESIRARN